SASSTKTASGWSSAGAAARTRQPADRSAATYASCCRTASATSTGRGTAWVTIPSASRGPGARTSAVPAMPAAGSDPAGRPVSGAFLPEVRLMSAGGPLGRHDHAQRVGMGHAEQVRDAVQLLPLPLREGAVGQPDPDGLREEPLLGLHGELRPGADDLLLQEGAALGEVGVDGGPVVAGLAVAGHGVDGAGAGRR